MPAPMLAGLALVTLGAFAPETPNVVLILADDLGIGDARCYNPDSKIPTPNIDRLAREGMRLTDAHSPSAVCTPTRYGVLTGRYAWRTRLKRGVLSGDSPNLIDPKRLTLPELLRERGYQTAAVGKWHLGFGTAERVDYSKPLRPGPLEHGFDSFFGIAASLDMPPYAYVVDHALEQPASESIEPSAHRRQGGGGFWRAGAIAPGFQHVDVLVRLMVRASDAIERMRAEDPERPFFLYFPLTAPHTPWVPLESMRGVSGAGYYGDFVAEVDAVVADVLDTLERLDLARDTIVVFTSDNGAHWPVEDVETYGHAANLHYRGQKADIFEGGHRVPFLVRWPGHVPGGAERADLFVLTDLMATLAGITGEPLPAGAGEDSLDQSAVLRGEHLLRPVRSSAVHHSINGTFALRSGRWKLIEGLGSGGFTQPKVVAPKKGGPAGQLYDLVADPSEANNLWLEQPEVVRELTALLDEVRAQ
jgi:arylsulfatase A-like enzyme